MGESKTDVDRVLELVKQTLEITEEETVKRYVGVDISKGEGPRGNLQQTAYIRNILTRYGMNDCRWCKTPMEEGVQLGQDTSIIPELEGPYREAIGMLNYVATNTRPDIAFATNALAQYTVKPNKARWDAVKRIMRYLHGTETLALNIEGPDERITAFCDADWAADGSDRRSVSGYVIFIGSTPVIWRARKQSCMSASTQEAEYVSLSDCSKEVVGLLNLLGEAKLQVDGDIKPITIHCDNTAAIGLAEASTCSSRSKHIETRFHIVRDYIRQGLVDVIYVPGPENTADIFTKSLGRTKHEKFVEMLGLVKITTP
jgi:hypothetical protein